MCALIFSSGRIEFHCSNYRLHNGIGRTYITVDGKEVYNMCTLKRDYYRMPVEGTYSQVEFIETVYRYLNASIEDCIKSQNPLVKVLVVLDRRIGKRTLLKMEEDIENEDTIIQYFYKLRCEAEGIYFLIINNCSSLLNIRKGFMVTLHEKE